jgi:class 3 adenylate cyclase
LTREFHVQRKLAAVFAAEVEGFSRLMSADENGTLRELAGQRAILDATIARFRGRIANTAGDSVLAEFPSVSDAAQCAAARLRIVFGI